MRLQHGAAIGNLNVCAFHCAIGSEVNSEGSLQRRREGTASGRQSTEGGPCAWVLCHSEQSLHPLKSRPACLPTLIKFSGETGSMSLG